MSASAPPRNKILAAPAAADAPALEHAGTRAGELFRSLAATLLTVVGIAAACGLAAVWALYTIEQGAVLREQNERTMRKLSESVIRGLEAVMLQGSAEAFYQYAARLKTVRGLTDLRVLRADGVEAFHDNRTLASVNARLGGSAYRVPTRANEPAYSLSSPHLDRALRDAEAVVYYESESDGTRLMTVLHPLANSQACHGCHGTDHAVRGFVKVTTSLDDADRAVRDMHLRTLTVLATALAAILLITYFLVRVVVVRRVRDLSAAMHAIVLGDYSTRAPERGRDELGDMARSFNRMAENLLVASARLNEKQDFIAAVLRGAHDGVVIADAKGDVVMANAAAEQLLHKKAKEIYGGGLKKLFDNQALMQGWCESLGDVAEEIIYRGKPLQVCISRIRAANRSDIGMAVMMRDISTERELREEVKRLHFTDAQTGIGNSRYLDHALMHHWARARTAQGCLALVLVNVDNLKELALTCGPAIQEIVVKSVALVLAQTFGKVMPLARVAEDTLAVLVFDATAVNAAELANAALARIHDTTVEGQQVWASCGIGAMTAHAADGRAELLAAATRALHDAIEAGSGSVRVETREGTPP